MKNNLLRRSQALLLAATITLSALTPTLLISASAANTAQTAAADTAAENNSTSQKLSDVVAGYYLKSDSKAAAILTSGALTMDKTVTVGSPSVAKVKVDGKTLTVQPDGNWVPYSYALDDAEPVLLDGKTEVELNGYSDSVKVVYRLSLADSEADALNLLNAVNALVKEKAALDYLKERQRDMDNLTSLTISGLIGGQLNPEFGAILNEDPVKDAALRQIFTDAFDGIRKNSLVTGKGESFAGHLKLVKLLDSYTIADYYANGNAYSKEIDTFVNYLDDMLKEGNGLTREERLTAFRAIMDTEVGGIHLNEYADRLLEAEKFLKNTQVALKGTSGLVSASADLTALLNALNRSDDGSVKTYTELPKAFVLEKSVSVAGPNKVAVDFKITNGSNKKDTISKVYDKDVVLSAENVAELKNELTAAAQDLNITDAYYTSDIDEKLDALVGLSVQKAAELYTVTWTTRKAEVKIVDTNGNVTTQTVDIENPYVQLPAAEPGYRNDYTLNGQAIDGRSYYVSPEQLGALLSGSETVTIKCETVDVALDLTDDFVAALNRGQNNLRFELVDGTLVMTIVSLNKSIISAVEQSAANVRSYTLELGNKGANTGADFSIIFNGEGFFPQALANVIVNSGINSDDIVKAVPNGGDLFELALVVSKGDVETKITKVRVVLSAEAAKSSKLEKLKNAASYLQFTCTDNTLKITLDNTNAFAERVAQLNTVYETYLAYLLATDQINVSYLANANGGRYSAYAQYVLGGVLGGIIGDPSIGDNDQLHEITVPVSVSLKGNGWTWRELVPDNSEYYTVSKDANGNITVTVKGDVFSKLIANVNTKSLAVDIALDVLLNGCYAGSLTVKDGNEVFDLYNVKADITTTISALLNGDIGMKDVTIATGLDKASLVDLVNNILAKLTDFDTLSKAINNGTPVLTYQLAVGSWIPRVEYNEGTLTASVLAGNPKNVTFTVKVDNAEDTLKTLVGELAAITEDVSVVLNTANLTISGKTITVTGDADASATFNLSNDYAAVIAVIVAESETDATAKAAIVKALESYLKDGNTDDLKAVFENITVADVIASLNGMGNIGFAQLCSNVFGESENVDFEKLSELGSTYDIVAKILAVLIKKVGYVESPKVIGTGFTVTDKSIAKSYSITSHGYTVALNCNDLLINATVNMFTGEREPDDPPYEPVHIDFDGKLEFATAEDGKVTATIKVNGETAGLEGKTFTVTLAGKEYSVVLTGGALSVAGLTLESGDYEAVAVYTAENGDTYTVKASAKYTSPDNPPYEPVHKNLDGKLEFTTGKDGKVTATIKVSGETAGLEGKTFTVTLAGKEYSVVLTGGALSVAGLTLENGDYEAVAVYTAENGDTYTVKASAKYTAPTDPDNPTPPKTGDITLVCAIISAIAAMTGGAVVFVKKRRKTNK